MRWANALAVLTLLLAVPTAARAQDADARLRISVDGGLQAAATALSQNFTASKNVEKATVSADIPLDATPFFDIGAWVRLVGRVGAGVAFTSVTRTSDAAIHAAIPHPFFYEQLRTISGTQPGVEGRERAVHVDAVVLAASTPRFELSVFAGATSFSLRQDVVADVSYTQSYPFDTAEFSEATIARASASKVGYNAGADVTWSFSEHIGVGGLLRFSRASVTYAAASGNEATAKVGGLQTGGGVRVRF
jgi:hypothetical protein